MNIAYNKHYYFVYNNNNFEELEEFLEKIKNDYGIDTSFLEVYNEYEYEETYLIQNGDCENLLCNGDVLIFDSGGKFEFIDYDELENRFQVLDIED